MASGSGLVPVVEGMEGGLFWGTTLVEPGQVDSEYFMTHGHLHAKRDRTEYYATIEGEGALILMAESRKTWTEPITPGSLHFIPPRIAHRLPIAEASRSGASPAGPAMQAMTTKPSAKAALAHSC